jgi:hypothetical protein
MSVFDRFMFFLWPEKLRDVHETVMKRSETVMNVEFSGTLDGLKRSYCTRTAERLKKFAKYRSRHKTKKIM